jgi:hypothetical protein
MKIDISRVNLLEKDIEDWLFENPDSIRYPYYENPITKWIGRQYQLPSGIADLIGIREDMKLVVVEIKNVPINKAAILQICRYAYDLKHIVSNRMNYPFVSESNEPDVEMVVIGQSIDGQTFMEAQAVSVNVYSFSVTLDLDVNRMNLTNEIRKSMRNQHDLIADKPEWGIYGLTAKEDYEQFERERAAAAHEDFSMEDIILVDKDDDAKDLEP